MTPMMRQYMEIKERTGDSILFFRMGDFYEMFGEDAKVASAALDLVLTTRDKSIENPDDRIPMCGIPYHAAQSYIARLIAKGYKVAICEQMEDPATAKGLVARDVVRIITPGTLMDSIMLDESRPNYLCSVYVDETSAICFADLSTGDISVTEFITADLEKIENEFSSYMPSEAILGGNPDICDKLRNSLIGKYNCLTEYDNAGFSDHAYDLILTQFGSDACEELGIAGVYAVGALLSYIIDTQKTDISHLQVLQRNLRGVYMELDYNTLRNLELVASLRTGDKKGSLLGVVDKTKTPMGRRLIRTWVLRPLLDISLIKRRLNSVSELFLANVNRSELILCLKNIGDTERLIGKIVYGNAVSRDLKALSSYIRELPRLTELLLSFDSLTLRECAGMDTLLDIAKRIDDMISDDPPFSVREGGFIKDGADSEVDRFRYLLENSTTTLAEIERRERERTGKKLKIGYNKVFGYYIEIPRSASDDVPGDYVRKQTLTNCERFITQELKELETDLLTAKDRLASLEYNLFEELRMYVAGEVNRVQSTSKQIAIVDALCSFAQTAVENDYTMPEIDLSGTINIRDGRHPVVEAMQKDILFVPNDTFLDNSSSRVAIITGPNMAGKSTYMRQTALIVLMAQMGGFVPASSAQIGIIDRVFTRIGASDDLSAGKSTFMVEMTEVADIIKNATKSSLIILDEIGRGTSTYDGMSIARAILEYCADKKKLGAKTLFATHYHELTVLENEIEGVKNYSISAKKRGDDIVFLRKIIPGGADDSYGIEVAGLAGVSDSIIKRAKTVLKSLENNEPATRTGTSSGFSEPDLTQMSMLDVLGNEIAEILKTTDLNTLSPLEALNLLYELKKKL